MRIRKIKKIFVTEGAVKESLAELAKSLRYKYVRKVIEERNAARGRVFGERA